ncbi:MAG: hypothetical protein ABSA46_00345 [Thermodesulfovibrionales bacterium]
MIEKAGQSGRCESGFRLAGLLPVQGLRCPLRRQIERRRSREMDADHHAALVSLTGMGDPDITLSTPYRKVKKVLQERLRLSRAYV